MEKIHTLSAKVRDGSYRPPIGLEAAMTAQRACSDVTMPAFDTEILCCSIASWILVLSASFIWNTYINCTLISLTRHSKSTTARNKNTSIKNHNSDIIYQSKTTISNSTGSVQYLYIHYWCYFCIQTRCRNKKLSYRWQTVRCWFVKLLRYGRTFCQNT